MYLNQSSQTEDGGVTVLRKAEAKKARSHRQYTCINDERSWCRLRGTLTNMTCGNVPWLCQIVHYVQRRPLRWRASESSQGHLEARSSLQRSKHTVTAVFRSHLISVQAFQYKRLLLLDTCSRYVHTSTAWQVQSLRPHKHCLTRAVGMSTQALLDTCSRYVYTSTAWHVQSICPHKRVKPLHYLPSVCRCNVSDCETSSSVTKCRYSVSNVAVRRAAWWRKLLTAHGMSGLREQNCCLSSADGGGWCYEQCRELQCWMEICERLVYSDWP